MIILNESKQCYYTFYVPIETCVRQVETAGRTNRAGCSDRGFRFCRRCISRIPALPGCVTHSPKYARKSRTQSIHFLAHAHAWPARAHIRSFIALDNTFAVPHARERILSRATHALRNPTAIDARPARVDSARTASGSALERGRLSRASGSCAAIS